MSNMIIYDAVRKTPQEARKTITGGRLNGFTDISPQYRIETLTKQLGPCGIGWHYIIEKQWTEMMGEEVLAFTNISLFIKDGGEWSASIPGTGGSTMLAKEKGGLRASDEAYKMSLTDALSVACKALGIGADIYWEKGESKYTRPAIVPDEPKEEPVPKAEAKPATRKGRIEALCAYHGITLESFKAFMKALQESGQISTKTTGAMDDQEFDVLLSLVHTAINDTISS